MGLVKSQLDQGYYSAEGRVCEDCFDDYALATFIQEHADGVGCDYCEDGETHKRPSTDFDEVMPFIFEGICREYTTPEQCLMLDDESESGFFGKVVDKDDLINDEIGLETSSDELRQQVIDSIEQERWCDPEQFVEKEHEELLYDWKAFTRLVKEEARFVFMKYGSREGNGLQERYLAGILEQTEKMAKKIGLFKALPAGTRFFRAREWNAQEPFPLNVSELGPPPSKVSARFPNRMSPPGIPMFYGSDSRKTAIAEIRGKKLVEAVTAEFEILKEIHVLDLTRIPALPSIFDPKGHPLRQAIQFFDHFLSDLTRPFSRDGREHVDYVPTQIFTEYFRLIAKSGDKKILGIIYPSARHSGGKSVVLFGNSKNCLSSKQDIAPSSLLRLTSRSIRRHKFK